VILAENLGNTTHPGNLVSLKTSSPGWTRDDEASGQSLGGLTELIQGLM
jgi:hypothetical protein